MERRLIGVVAGGGYESSFGRVSEFSVSPSPELLKNLSELPPGTKVGLETMREFFDGSLSVDGFDLDGANVTFSQFGEVYWQQVYDVCVQSDLVPVFLDDLDLHRKEARLKIKIRDHNLDEGDIYIATRSRIQITDKDKPQFMELGRLLAELNYVHLVERYEKMIQTIKEQNVDVVIVSLGFAFYIARDLKKLKASGVNFTTYFKDVPDMNFSASMSNMPKVLDASFSHGIGDEDNKLLVGSEVSVRKHLAYTEGRVAVSHADYIGTFSPNCPPEGLFQIESNGDREGKIKDTLGDAVWSGEITDNEVDFRKTYKVSSSVKDALKSDIIYKGKWNGNSYVGTWRDKDDTTSGDFIMYKGAFYPLDK